MFCTYVAPGGVGENHGETGFVIRIAEANDGLENC